MSGLPLFQSIAQSLSPNAVNRVESIDVDGISAYAGDALGQLVDLGYPFFDDPHPNNPLLVVTYIGMKPITTSKVRVSYTYGPPQQAGGIQDVIQLDTATWTFDVQTNTDTAAVPYIDGQAFSTETQEVDDSGDPTGNTVGKSVPGFVGKSDNIEHDTARITLSVSGTPEAIGLPSDFTAQTYGSIGSVPNIVGLARTIHDIGGAALLFRGMNVSWSRSGPGGRVYRIDYEWRFEAGIANTSANMPDGWTDTVDVGPAGGFRTIQNARGRFDVDSNGDRFYGVALPNVEPLPQLIGVGHINGSRTYIKPPYCRAMVGYDRGDEFPVPKFYAVAEYDNIDANDTWRLFPGVG